MPLGPEKQGFLAVASSLVFLVTLGSCAILRNPGPPPPQAPPAPPSESPSAPAPPPVPTPRLRLDAYLEARQRGDFAAAQSFLAPDCRIWYEDKDGPGTPLNLLDGSAEWDAELNATSSHGPLTLEENRISGLFTERNDFYELLGIPEWRAHITFWFDAQGLITEELYEPLPDNPDFDAHFLPALIWASRNRPQEVAELLPGEKLVRNRDTARRWRILLEEWRRTERGR